MTMRKLASLFAGLGYHCSRPGRTSRCSRPTSTRAMNGTYQDLTKLAKGFALDIPFSRQAAVQARHS